MKTLNQFTRNKIELFLLFIVLPILSCNKTINNPVEHFENSPRQELTPSRRIGLEEFDILKPGLVIRKDDSYMIWDLNNENMFHLINFNSKKVNRGIKKGNGPGEIIGVMGFQLKDDKFLVYDGDRKKMNQINVTSDTLILKEIKEIHFDTRLFITNYQGSHVIATGLFEDAWLASIKGNGEIISKVDFPDFEETSNTPGMELSMLYISTHIANKPDNKKVVAATQYLGLLSFFDYIDGSILKECKQNKYYGPDFTLPERGGIAYSKNGIIGFCGLDCDDDYVYALYSGRTFTEHGMESHHCEHLLVYDWNGNPIQHYILGIPLSSVKYDKEKNTIYGIGYDPEGVFVEYQLDNQFIH